LPVRDDDNEPKTKPTQYAVRTLNSAGLQPDMILARAKEALDKKRKEKIAFNCNLREEDIISAPDVSSLYDIPVNFEKDRLGDVVLGKLGLRSRKSDLRGWRRFVEKTQNAKTPVRIGIVGKYFSSGKSVLTDSYISVIESVKHAAAFWGVRPEIVWLDAQKFERGGGAVKELADYGGIIVPGGFGSRGVKGKIAAIRFCREQKIPYLGLCYGMQLAVVEFARNVLKLKNADTTEINPKTKYPVIDILPEQKKLLAGKHYGGTMRLGAWPATLKKGTIAERAYGKQKISERHRHRYEVNPVYVKRLEGRRIIFSGISPDRRLMETLELSRDKHPFFLGTQFHPELKSRPLSPHPLFREFVRVSVKNKNLTKT